MTFLGTTLIYGPDMFCMLQTALLLHITWHWHTAINKPNRQPSHLTSCHDDDELQMTGKCKAVPSYTRSPQAAWPSWQPGTMTSVPAPRLDTCLAAPGTRPWVVCGVLPPDFMEIRKSFYLWWLHVTKSQECMWIVSLNNIYSCSWAPQEVPFLKTYTCTFIFYLVL